MLSLGKLSEYTLALGTSSIPQSSSHVCVTNLWWISLDSSYAIALKWLLYNSFCNSVLLGNIQWNHVEFSQLETYKLNRQKENAISHPGKAEFSDNKTLLVGRCCLNPFYLLLHILKMSPGVSWLGRVAWQQKSTADEKLLSLPCENVNRVHVFKNTF